MAPSTARIAQVGDVVAVQLPVTSVLGKALSDDILASTCAAAPEPVLPDDVMPNYFQAAQRAVEYLSQRVLDDSWVAEHEDLGFYFKAPMAFLELGRHADARKALLVAVRLLSNAGSATGACNELYPQYSLLWLAWAAERLGVAQFADKCYESIAKFAHPVTGSGLIEAPYLKGKPFESSFFATAVLAKAALLHGKLDNAIESGESLQRAIRANEEEMAQGRFLLRWTWADGLVRESGAYYQVTKASAPEQMHWMLGFPASVLLELVDALSEEDTQPEMNAGDSLRRISAAFSSAAATLLDFLRACDQIGTNGQFVACAAAQAKDQAMATELVESLLSTQGPSGCFQHDTEAMHTVDQAAEIACCLQQLRHSLSNPDKYSMWRSTRLRPVCRAQTPFQSLAAMHTPKRAGLMPASRTGAHPVKLVQALPEAPFPRRHTGDSKPDFERGVASETCIEDVLGNEAAPELARNSQRRFSLFGSCCSPHIDENGDVKQTG